MDMSETSSLSVELGARLVYLDFRVLPFGLDAVGGALVEGTSSVGTPSSKFWAPGVTVPARGVLGEEVDGSGVGRGDDGLGLGRALGGGGGVRLGSGE
jgi:hypothetical protein